MPQVFLNALECYESTTCIAWCASGLSWHHEALFGARLAAPRIAWRAVGCPGNIRPCHWRPDCLVYVGMLSKNKRTHRTQASLLCKDPIGNQVDGFPLVAHVGRRPGLIMLLLLTTRFVDVLALLLPDRRALLN